MDLYNDFIRLHGLFFLYIAIYFSILAFPFLSRLAAILLVPLQCSPSCAPGSPPPSYTLGRVDHPSSFVAPSLHFRIGIWQSSYILGDCGRDRVAGFAVLPWRTLESLASHSGAVGIRPCPSPSKVSRRWFPMSTNPLLLPNCTPYGCSSVLGPHFSP